MSLATDRLEVRNWLNNLITDILVLLSRFEDFTTNQVVFLCRKIKTRGSDGIERVWNRSESVMAYPMMCHALR